MLNGNHNCKEGHGSTIVDYLYGEADNAARAKFEDHLASCSSCTDEFAAIADVRLGVLEWRRAAFDPLATPEIELATVAPEASPSGLFEAIRSIFAWRAFARASVGFAALLIIAASVYFIGSFNTGPQDIARNTNVDVEPAVEAHLPARASSVDEGTAGPAVVAPRSEEPADIPQRRAIPEASRRPAQAAVSEGRNKRKPATTEVKAPRLNNFEEAEDTSLRLSDLLAQIGGEK